MKRAALVGAACWLLAVGAGEAREQIRVVGSGAPFAYAHMVAEQFAQSAHHRAPSLDLTGAAIGFRQFCAGVGFEYPDVNVTSRPMTVAEFSNCQQHGVASISEIAVGQEVLLLVNAESSPRLAITAAELFSALADRVPVNGELQVNPYERWSDIRGTLPDVAIQVMGPAPASPSHDALMALVMDRGCQSFASLQQLEADRREQVCRTLRRDGAYLDGMRNEREMLQWLRDNPNAYGLMSYRWWYEEGQGELVANPIDDVPPSEEKLSDARYPLARPVFLYVKNQHVGQVPGLQEFLYEFTAERTIGPDGYLVDKGFVPLNDRGRNRAREAVLSLQPISRE
ncbi:MAG: substrate-binding domain-containing protein [Gammaproteobacteria bacterium]